MGYYSRKYWNRFCNIFYLYGVPEILCWSNDLVKRAYLLCLFNWSSNSIIKKGKRKIRAGKPNFKPLLI